jgi:mxaJ protein
VACNRLPRFRYPSVRRLAAGSNRLARSRYPELRLLVAACMVALGVLPWRVAPVAAQAWEMRVCADPTNAPFSRRNGTGFENRIAEVLASALDAELTYVWWPLGPTMISDQLREGSCDLIMGVPDGYPGLTTTIAYYRSPYVFVYRADRGYRIGSFDDPKLRELRVGIQTAGGPPHEALLNRGIRENLVLDHADRTGATFDPEPFAALIMAVARGDLDVAVPWGPAAGYHAAREGVELVVEPVTPEFEPPFTPMFLSMVIGVRRGDEALRDRLGLAIAERWDEIQQILAEYHVPLLPLPRPAATLGGR